MSTPSRQVPWCWLARLVVAGLLLPACGAGPTNHTGTVQSSRLYTPPDPTAPGGLRGRLVLPPAPLQHAFALPVDDPSRVYRGTVSADGREFLFQGLPTAKYDLVLVLTDRFYEGLTLTREANTLTDRDRQLIRDKLLVSTPFFDTKEIHRCAGTTGREGRARCVVQELRTRPITLQDASVRADLQVRSFKLALLEDVGPAGWQVIRTREILRQEVAAGEPRGILPCKHNPALSGIRVIDTVKDLGEIVLK